MDTEVQRAGKSQVAMLSVGRGWAGVSELSPPSPHLPLHSACRRLITGNTALRGKLYSRKAIYSLSLIQGMSDNIMDIGTVLEELRNLWKRLRRG